MPGEWFRAAFDETYLDRYYRRDDEEADGFVAAILAHHPPPDGGLVLDVACGMGRHSRTVARRGYRVIGVDLSMTMLERAASSTEDASGMAPLFVRADKRALPFPADPGRADMVLNLFTSFGYFLDDEENRSAFHQMAGALRPGGLMVVDFLNRDQLIGGLVPEDEEWREGLRITQNRRITEDGLRIEKRVTLSYADDRQESLFESVRLYSPEQLEELARSAGLQVERCWGDYSGAPHGPHSSRFILFARRPV